MVTSPQGAATTDRQGVTMIKRAIRFATLMTVVALPAWFGVQGAGNPTALGAGDTVRLAPALQNPQIADANAIASQSFWHLMALSSR